MQLARVNLGFAAQTDRAASSSRWCATPRSMTTRELAGELRELTDRRPRGAR